MIIPKWYIKTNKCIKSLSGGQLLLGKDPDAADAVARQANRINKQVTFKTCPPFIAYLSEKHNTQVTMC